MSSNARLRESMRWLNKPETVTASGLRQMVISHLLANEGDTCVSEEVTKLLIRTYLTALTEQEDENGKTYTRVQEQAAFDLFRKEYVNGFRSFFPDATEERVTQDLSWPDLLPYHNEYTISFIKEVGFAFGYYWGRWSKGAQEYMKQEQEKANANQ